MDAEIKIMNAVNEAAEDKCKVEFIAVNLMPKNRRPFGKGVLGYKVNGIKAHPECQWMAIEEPNFVNYMRRKQDHRASDILKTLRRK